MPTRLASRSRVARQAGAGVGPHAAPAVLASFAAHRCVIKAQKTHCLFIVRRNVPRQSVRALSCAEYPKKTRFQFISYKKNKDGVFAD